MNFKQIPLELVDNNIIFASKDGQIKIAEKLINGSSQSKDNNESFTNLRLINGSKSNKGANGYYKTFGYKNKNYYIHKLVFYAHSDLTIEQLKNGRVIFKNFIQDMIDEQHIYKCRFEDLLFEPFKIIKEDPTEEPVESEHSIYGKFKYNEWYGCSGSELKFIDYQIMPINNNIQSCIIKNIKTNKILCTKSHNNYDPSINIVHNKKNYGLLLSHLLLNSVFPNIKTNETVDHIDDNPLNNNIINLQWMSLKENSKKGQIKSNTIINSKKTEDLFEVFNLKDESVGKFKMKKDLVEFMINKMNIKSGVNTVQGKIDRALNTDGFAYSHKYKYIIKQNDTEQNNNITVDEEWKELNINEYTKKYLVSNKGQIKLNDILLIPHKVRGRKYSQISINIDENKHEKYYIHQLVWIAHKGLIPEDNIILHDDAIELVNGYYRNWLCDLSIGDYSTNNKEHHFQKRINLS
jgi:hypothetical protein